MLPDLTASDYSRSQADVEVFLFKDKSELAKALSWRYGGASWVLADIASRAKLEKRITENDRKSTAYKERKVIERSANEIRGYLLDKHISLPSNISERLLLAFAINIYQALQGPSEQPQDILEETKQSFAHTIAEVNQHYSARLDYEVINTHLPALIALVTKLINAPSRATSNTVGWGGGPIAAMLDDVDVLIASGRFEETKAVLGEAEALVAQLGTPEKIEVYEVAHNLKPIDDLIGDVNFAAPRIQELHERLVKVSLSAVSSGASDASRLPITPSAQPHQVAAAAVETPADQPVVQSPSKPVSGVAGVDFTTLPITIQPSGSLSLNLPPQQIQSLSRLNLTEESCQINNLITAGITPSPERIKELCLAFYVQQDLKDGKDTVLSCIRDTLRLQEGSLSSTEPEYNELLTLLESIS
jgi:hypothetical protein